MVDGVQAGVQTHTAAATTLGLLFLQGDERINRIDGGQVQPLVTVWRAATRPVTGRGQDGQKHSQMVHRILAPHTIVRATAKGQKVALIGNVFFAFRRETVGVKLVRLGKTLQGGVLGHGVWTVCTDVVFLQYV